MYLYLYIYIYIHVYVYIYIYICIYIYIGTNQTLKGGLPGARLQGAEAGTLGVLSQAL